MDIPAYRTNWVSHDGTQQKSQLGREGEVGKSYFEASLGKSMRRYLKHKGLDIGQVVEHFA